MVSIARMGAATVVVALSITACGSSSKSSGTGATSAAAGTSAAGASAGSSSAAAGSSTAAMKDVSLKIMVGGISKQIYLPNELTAKLGYFKEQHLNVTLIDEASGQSSEQQVLAGGVQAGSGSYNHTIELQPSGKFIESVVQLQLAPGEALMVNSKQASSITSAKALSGKNLGVTELGSGTQTLTSAIMGEVGLDPNSGHFIPVGAGDTFIAAVQHNKIAAGMTTEPTISRLIKTGAAKVLVDLRTPTTTRAALGGDYPFICLFMKTDYVNSHKDVVQRLVNAYVKTLKWMAAHTATEIADMMPTDYYAGDKAAYITALEGQKASFTPDGVMPATGAQTVYSIEQKYVPIMKGKTADVSKSYTNEFASKATG
ncbi:MAG: sulfonate transport system substrate-binding protein [Frankiales bacterium]|nr:sulfonate transport system substrate-binding protein [Frankiales bacterium]